MASKKRLYGYHTPKKAPGGASTAYSDPTSLRYNFGWGTALNDGACGSAAGMVEISTTMLNPIVFPPVESRTWTGRATFIRFYSIPPERYANYGWSMAMDALPKEGVYWFDIKPAKQATDKGEHRFMGYLAVTGFGGHVDPTGTMARVLKTSNETFYDELYVEDMRFLAKLLLEAQAKARVLYQKDVDANKGFLGWGRKPAPDSPEKAFYMFYTLCSRQAENTGTARAYLVDWALAERRTGLKFESMEAFEEWAAQHGMTVLGVVDAASASASEDEE